MIQGLPQRLQALRAEHGLSQKQVAAKLGVSPAIISGYETGERTPSLEMFLALSYLYRCSADSLLGRRPLEETRVLHVDHLTDRQIAALSAFLNTIEHD